MPTSKSRGRPKTTTSHLVPAAARAGEVLSHDEVGLNNEAIDLFTKAVGGRQALTDVLSIAGTGGDIDRVTSLLLDPRYRTTPLRRLCTIAGITVADLFAAFKRALHTRAHIAAAVTITSKLGAVVDDVMTRAAPQRQVCPSCQGASSAGTAPCPVCSSTGHIQTEPDLDRQKLALELGQLTEKKAGIVMQQNTIAAASSSSLGAGGLERLQQLMGDELFGAPKRRRPAGPPDADDGEVVGDPPESHHSLTDPPGEYEPPLPFDHPADAFPDPDHTDDAETQPDADA